ncbi:MAG TPA: hypothetical protein VJI32_07790 [Candidatus Nanoarchaeia archaeon]|nr:hypothetical protein [Candidatus Nanoarchaeia archaeon]
MKRILFLENHPSLLDALLQEFTDLGYQCSGASTSELALELLAKERYDAIIIDPSEDDRVVGTICLSDILQREYPRIVRIGFSGEYKAREDPVAQARYKYIVIKTTGYDEELDSLLKDI